MMASPIAESGARASIFKFLASLPLLQALPAASVREVADQVVVLVFQPGDILAKEGTSSRGLYIVRSGEVRAVQASNHVGSTDHTSLVLSVGDHFGGQDNCATDFSKQHLHAADVIAVSKVTVLLLPNEHCHLLSPDGTDVVPPEGEKQALISRILQLERLEVDFFRGVTIPEANLYPRLFGGQLLGQGLWAACQSVDASLGVHSLHSYFLLPGDPNVPIIYRVDHIRDGKSFATRHVVAIQKGRTIFSLHASFQRAEEGLEHQYPMPEAPGIDTVPTWEELQEEYYNDPRVSPEARERFKRRRKRPIAIDMKFCNPIDRVEPQARPPRQLIWWRARGNLGGDQALHQATAAYASDFSFLETALLPHGFLIPDRRLVVASLDHSMWFHRPFRADDWLLYQVESPRSSGSRGFCLGRMYTRSGELVVSTAQEGLIRLDPTLRSRSAAPGVERDPALFPNKVKNESRSDSVEVNKTARSRI